MTQKDMLVEAEMQKNEINKLIKWYRILLILSSIFFAIAYWVLKRNGPQFVIGVLAVIFVVICIFLSAVLNLGIKRGRVNVVKILELLEK